MFFLYAASHVTERSSFKYEIKNTKETLPPQVIQREHFRYIYYFTKLSLFSPFTLIADIVSNISLPSYQTSVSYAEAKTQLSNYNEYYTLILHISRINQIAKLQIDCSQHCYSNHTFQKS